MANKYAQFSKAKDRRRGTAAVMCLRKSRYKTPERAAEGVANLNAHLGITTSRAYQCPQCGLWHVTKGGE